MVRISFVAVCVVVALLMTLPFANAFVMGQGNRTYFPSGGACLGPDCSPMGAPMGPPIAYQGPMPGSFAPGMPVPGGMPMPRPSKISKCKQPPMPSCMPAPCMPMPMCGPVCCPPPCKPPVAWY